MITSNIDPVDGGEIISFNVYVAQGVINLVEVSLLGDRHVHFAGFKCVLYVELILEGKVDQHLSFISSTYTRSANAVFAWQLPTLH